MLQSQISRKKDPIKQLEASTWSVKDLFYDLLNKTKCFKYQKPNGEIKFTQVYFNSTTKTVINNKFSLKNACKNILSRIDNWINEGFGWTVESVKSQCINISIYRPLSGSSYVKLPTELRSLKKD